MNLSGYFRDTPDGQGPVLVMLHPFPLTHEVWMPLAQELADTHCAVFAPDMRGYDGAFTPPPEEWSVPAMAADVLESLDALGITERPLILMGCSMGGYIIFELWRFCPERIRQIYIINSRANADTDAARAVRAATRARLDAEGSYFLISAQPELLMSKASAAKPELVKRLLVMGSMIPRDALNGTLIALGSRPDSTSTLGTITVPTVVTVGSEDVVSPPEVARAMTAAIPTARLFEFPGVGHLPMIEAPEEFSRIVRETLLV